MKYLIVVLCIFAISLFKSNAQRAYVPIGHVRDYGIHKGCIVLNEGTKVCGNFQYAELEFPTYNFKHLDSANKLLNRFKFSKIRSAKLAGSDHYLSNRDSTSFVKLFAKDKTLYRQLTFGDIQIYDQLFVVDEEPGAIGRCFIVIVDGKKYTMKNIDALLLFMKNLRPELIQPSMDSRLTVRSMIKRLNN